MKPALLYADDALFFIRPNDQKLQILTCLLIAFQNISARASTNKNCVGFLINVQAQLAQFMGCKAGSFPFLYLGLPLSHQKIPKKAYYPIIDKIKRRLAGWKTNKPIIHCGLYCSHKLCTHGHACRFVSKKN